MPPPRKKFDRALFLENDRKACGAVIQALQADGTYVVRNKDRYGPDIVVYDGLKPARYVECEIKKVWKEDQDEFPWLEINLPERKEKFMRLRTPIEFWILRADLRKAVVIPGKVAKKSPKEEVSNIYVRKGEMFFRVPISKCTIIDLPEFVDTQEMEIPDGDK